VILPADPGRGLLRFNAYVQAPFGMPRDRAVAFLTAFLAGDEHGYVLTHQILVLLWAESLDFRLPEALHARRGPLMQRLADEQRASPPRFSDLYAERVAILLAFGPPPPLAADWLAVIVAAQQADGRWLDDAASTITYDGQSARAVHEWTHTSGLSVVALDAWLSRR
jgi:hypothetical protein